MPRRASAHPASHCTLSSVVTIALPVSSQMAIPPLYLGLPTELSAHFGCAVNAYVLITNHEHLLLTPGPGKADGPALLIQRLGQLYCLTLLLFG